MDGNYGIHSISHAMPYRVHRLHTMKLHKMIPTLLDRASMRTFQSHSQMSKVSNECMMTRP